MVRNEDMCPHENFTYIFHQMALFRPILGSMRACAPIHSLMAVTQNLTHWAHSGDFRLCAAPEFVCEDCLVFGLFGFNAHYAKWPSSNKTDHVGRSVHEFTPAYSLTELLTTPTQIPDVESQNPSLLDLLIIVHRDGFRVSADALLNSSHHCLIRSIVLLTRAVARLTCKTYLYCLVSQQIVMEYGVYIYLTLKEVWFLLDTPNALADVVPARYGTFNSVLCGSSSWWIPALVWSIF